MTRQLISIVIPAFNEEDCVQELSERLKKLFDIERRYSFEVIVVENGSTDRTLELLAGVRDGDTRFRIVELSRNFGTDGAITAGLHYAAGDACVIMMADLQEPPELVSEMLRKWEEGYENVYGLVTRRVGTGALRNFNSRAFYKIASKLSNGSITPDASDFRLVDRQVYQEVLRLSETSRFLRGLFSWVGFRSIGVPFERQERFGGESKARTTVVVALAVRGILSNSVSPLRAITTIGILSAFAGIALFTFFTIRFLTVGVPFDGFGTLVALNLIGFSAVTLFLGIIGEYLGLTYEETKRRPNFIVRDFHGSQ